MIVRVERDSMAGTPAGRETLCVRRPLVAAFPGRTPERPIAVSAENGPSAPSNNPKLGEAIGVGDRSVVCGRSAKLLADIHVAQWSKSQYPVLREMIQPTLQGDSPDPRLR
jgi:hypothetical protein